MDETMELFLCERFVLTDVRLLLTRSSCRRKILERACDSQTRGKSALGQCSTTVSATRTRIYLTLRSIRSPTWNSKEDPAPDTARERNCRNDVCHVVEGLIDMHKEILNSDRHQEFAAWYTTGPNKVHPVVIAMTCLRHKFC